jgi:hypothetical protein
MLKCFCVAGTFWFHGHSRFARIQTICLTQSSFRTLQGRGGNWHSIPPTGSFSSPDDFEDISSMYIFTFLTLSFPSKTWDAGSITVRTTWSWKVVAVNGMNYPGLIVQQYHCEGRRYHRPQVEGLYAEVVFNIFFCWCLSKHFKHCFCH